MKKEFFDFIWKVIDKYGYNVLISFILGIITIVKIPTQYINMLPFEKQNIYWALVMCIVAYTLIIAFLRYSVKEIRNKIYWSSCNAEYKRKEERENLQKLWDMVDSFSEDERKDLKRFLKTGNKPIPKYSNYSSFDSLYHTNWVVSIEKYTTEEFVEINPETGKEEKFNRISTHLYKLNDNIYEILRYSMEKYGRISNFEE